MAGANPPRHPAGIPLQYLPFQARQEIANLFDGDYTRFRLLASILGFSELADCIWTRGFQGRHNSGTHKLLDECHQKGLTIQHLYNAIRQMNHSAVHIINDWMPYIERDYQAMVHSRMYLDNGQQNSCACTSCNRPSMSRQRSVDPPGSIPIYRRQTSETISSRKEPLDDTDPGPMHVYTSNGPGLNQSGSYNGRYVGDTVNVPDLSCPQNPTDVPQIVNRTLPCDCQKCRLMSDPNETQLLVYRGSNKESCLVSEMGMLGIAAEDERERRRRPSDRQDDGARPKSNKICAKSTNGVHYVGERPETCPVCSSPYSTFRHSWPPSTGLKDDRSVRDSSSDISLNTHEPSTTVINNRLNDFHSVGPVQGGDNNDLDSHRNIPGSRSVNNSGTNNISMRPGQSERNGESPHSSVSNQQGNGFSNTRGNRSQENQKGQTNSKNERSARSQASGIKEPTPPESGADQPIVFITYSPHSNTHLLEIKELISQLQQAGIRVKIDMAADCFDELSLNRNEWLDRSVDNARYVIVCISPTYNADVRDADHLNSPSPRISQLNAHYIYDRLRTEYINNQSQNRRMLPVLFPNTGAVYPTHVPHFMQPTLVYTFPGQAGDIIGRIIGRDKQLPNS